jgi:hypothetical protein
LRARNDSRIITSWVMAKPNPINRKPQRRALLILTIAAA